jgi:hypothetical protein
LSETVIAFHEDRVEPGDAPVRRCAAALQQLGQKGEHRRGESPVRGGLADGKADLPLGAREARDRIEEEHHVLALVAEELRHGGGDVRPADPGKRRLVGGGYDDDRTREPLRSQVVLDELADLPSALADEGDDVHVCRGVARDHAQQGGFPDAASGEYAHALALAHREQGVD